MEDLTEKQKSVLGFIVAYIERRGIPPSQNEIAHEFGFRQEAARGHLLSLEKKGRIKTYFRVGRGIKVLEQDQPA